MTDTNLTAAMAAWLKTRPECVQKLAAEFPVGTIVPRQLPRVGGWMVIGYGEPDHVVVSPIDPMIDYEQAMRLRRHICASHLRDLQ